MNFQLTSNSIASENINNNSIKRSLLLFSIFLFPIIISSLIFLLVFLVSDIEFNSVGAETEYAKITTPSNQTRVGKKFSITGEVKAPLDKHSYYLMEYREKKYWPKYALGNTPQAWKKDLTNRAKKNKFSSFLVIMADQKLKIIIDKWFKTAREKNHYPGISDLKIEHIVAKIRVQKK